MNSLLLLGMPGPMEWIIIAAIALLLFGRRLPEVGKSAAQFIVQFKRGLKDVDVDVEDAVNRPAPATGNVAITSAPGGTASVAGYKFDPHTGQPLNPIIDVPQPRFDPYTGKPLS